MPGDEYRLASSKGSTIGGSAAGDVTRGPCAEEYEEFIEHWKIVRHALEVRHGKESIESLLSEFRQRCPNIPESERVYLLENALREFYGEPKPYHVLNFYPPMELPDAQAH